MSIIGSLILRMGADAKPLLGALDQAGARIKQFGSSAGSGIGIGAAMGVTTRVIDGVISGARSSAGAIFGAITAASDLNETLSKTGIIFGASAGLITSKADELSTAFGVNKDEYITAAGNFGAVFKGAGKGQEEAAGLGNQLAMLGMDLAAFENTSNTDAFGAISSALRGEFDPIERYRVFLSAAKVEQQALSMGFTKGAAGLDENAKKMATLALITGQTADAQGNLALTANEPAAQFRRLTGIVENFAISLGQSLLPAVSTGTGILIEFATNAATAFESLKGPISEFASGAMITFAEWAPTFQTAADVIVGSVINIGSQFSTFFQNIAAYGKWFSENWVQLLLDDITRVGTMAKNLVTGNWGGGGTGLDKGFQAKSSGPPEWLEAQLLTMDDIVAARGKGIGQTLKKSIWEQGAFEQDLLSTWDQGDSTPQDFGKSTWDQGAFAEDLKNQDWSRGKGDASGFSVAELGSAEAASAIARHRNNANGADDKPIKSVEKTTREQLTVQNRMARSLDDISTKLANNSLDLFPITG